MKTLIFLLATSFFCCALANAQPAEKGDPVQSKNVMLTKDSVLYKRIFPARFVNGRYAFDDAMKRVLTPYFRKTGMNHFKGTGWLTVVGKITENGNIIDMVTDRQPNSEFVAGLVTQLGLLPALLPALSDGKPVKERFSLILEFGRGYYSFQYHFLGPAS